MRILPTALPLFFAASLAFSQSTGTQVNLTFNSPATGFNATQGNPLTVTADRPVTWSLAPGSAGSLNAVSSTVAVYTPPQKGLKAKSSIGGCLVLPNDSVYNTPISQLPVHPSSSEWVGATMSYGTVGLSFVNPWGVNLIDSSYPTTNPTFYYSWQLNGKPFQLVTGAWRKRESGSLTLDPPNDHHLVSLNHQTCRFYETYQDGFGQNGTTAQSGYTYVGTGYTQPSSEDGGWTTDAAGLPLMPLTLHLSEIESGAVNHALRFTSCTGCISNQFVWPATYSTGGVLSSAAAPMGSRWRLKASFDISGFSAKAQVVLKALQQYGMMLADNGTINQIQTDSDVNLDPEVSNALGEIAAAKLPASDFEVVDESSLEVSSGSNQAKQSTATANGFSFAVINAQDSKGNKVSVPVALQPVLVGTPYENMIFQAGQSLQLAAWVNGTANTAVTWSATLGSVSADGVYTAPSSVASPTPVIISAASQADPTASATINGWVVPSGAVRIDVGSTNNYTDTSGNVWMADTLGFESGAFRNIDDNYPSNAWGSLKDATIYETYNHTYGDDITYGPFVVPNGTYSISFLFAKGVCSGTYSASAQTDNHLTTGPLVLEANGADTTFDLAAAEHDSCRTAATGNISATVTNNLLTVAVRSSGTSSSQSEPTLNGLSIVPAGTPSTSSGTTTQTPSAHTSGSTSSAPPVLTPPTSSSTSSGAGKSHT